MNDAVNLRVLGEDIIESALVGDVELVESRTASADFLNSVEDIFERIVQAVNNDDVVAILEEGKSGEGANVASATAEGGVRMRSGVLRISRRSMSLPSDEDGSNSHFARIESTRD